MDPTSSALVRERQEIIDAFRGELYLSDQYRVQSGFLWDSVSYSRGAFINRDNSQFFSNVGAMSGKTIADSNMDIPRILPAPSAFSATRIILTFANDVLDVDYHAFCEMAAFEFWIGQRLYIRAAVVTLPAMQQNQSAPIRICGYCTGVYANSATCPNCGASCFSLSHVDGTQIGRQLVIDVAPRLVIANCISFYARFEMERYAVIGERFKVWCHLEGLHVTGVQ